ncbi:MULTISPECIES: hypothetical protein [Thalassotalea]|uniref:Uncharacterized protein n=1 Tax=Thalassotalea castellviae TaxID=3075612 RepID=A0ABU3A443_9GAMM|nr:hypothetical protein [Thalassotalea sp. W431]MDT0604638.1 hypothetical protein [Thalassotalea sp. W431]
MIIDTYDETETINDEFDSGIAGYEIAYSSTQKTMTRKSAKQRDRIRQRLDSLCEAKVLNKQLNSFSDYWDM